MGKPKKLYFYSKKDMKKLFFPLCVLVLLSLSCQTKQQSVCHFDFQDFELWTLQDMEFDTAVFPDAELYLSVPELEAFLQDESVKRLQKAKFTL